MRKLRTRWLALPIFTLLLAIALPASAQTVTGTLQGMVSDSDKGVLPGVSIAVRGVETGLERDVVTNERGFYTATFLPIGNYRVTATLSGFGSAVRDGVEIQLNRTTVADFTLDPRATAEVRVTAETPRINTVNGEIKESLTAEAIAAKPTVNPGSFLSLVEVFAGFQENPTSGQNNPTASSGSSVNFNGTGTRGATFQINGVNNDDSSENQNRQGVALSTIKELQVITNNFTAEFGRGYGAVVLVQTKSGTNELKGDAYAFHNDTEWSDKSHFSSRAPKPLSTRSQYGMTAGFPLMQDTLFGFIAADQTELNGDRTITRDIFTAEDLARPRLTRGNDTPANRAFIEDILARFGTLTPNDSRSTRTWSGFQEFDFPDEDYSARLDWQPGSTDAVTGRWQYTRQIRAAEDIIIGEAALQNHKQQNYGLTWTHIFSAQTVGEARYGLGLRDTNVDIDAGNDTPIVRFGGTPVAASIIGNAGNFPIHRDQTDHQFVYNHSTVLGSNHFIRAGTDVRLQQLDDLADNNSRGSWSFTATCAGTTYPNSWAAFLDGCVNSFSKGYGPFSLENRINEYNLYLEDSWQAFSNLTLNVGVRYDYVEVPKEANDRIDYGFEDDRDNVAPRVSFAWSPEVERGFLRWLTGGPGNFSIRGGYGIYYGRLFQSVFSQTGSSLRTNPPNAILLTPTNSLNVADPTNGFVFTPGPQTTRHSLTIADPELEMPYTHQWNLTLERNLPWNSAVRVSYTGTRGEGLLRYSLDNLAVTPAQGGIVVVNHPNNAPAAGFPDLRGVLIDRVAADWRCAGTGFIPGVNVNATCPVPVPIAPNEISLRVPRNNERRPDPRYSTNLIVSNGAQTEYDGFQIELTKRLSQGLMLSTSYTYSKAKDNVSEATFVGTGDSNQTGPNGDFAWGYSRFDTRHRFTLNGAYMLPFFRDRKDLLGLALGGWQVAAFLKIASGTPFTVIDSAGGDIDWDGFSENRPVVVDRGVEGRTIDDQGTSQRELPRSAFRRATPEDSIEDLTGRNTFFTDGVRNLDLGVYKTFLLPWDHSLSVRFEVFNVFNREQFGFPTNDFASTNFGLILSTSVQYTPRTIQVGARYAF